jgi:hypothetical protein
VNRPLNAARYPQVAGVFLATTGRGYGKGMDGTIPRLDGQLTVSGAVVARYCLAIAGAATAVIHFAVAGEHFAEYWLFGAFMLAVAWLQVMWSVAVVVRPWRWVLWGGALMNAGVIVIYIITRTVGDLVGPTPHGVEPLGFGDGLCTVLEAVVVVGCLWLLVSRKDRQVRRAQLFAVPGLAGVTAAALLSVALVAGGPEMVMSADAGTGPATASAHHMHMAMSSAKSTAISLATTSPAGDVTMPKPSMQMAPGMRMAGTAMCSALPTGAQKTATVKLVNASWRDARRFRSLPAARAAGYVPITPAGLPVVHYLNYQYYLATMRGGPVLNTTKPQSLVYANTAKGAVLAAAMYIAPPDRVTPRPGGCLTQWHVHTNLCQTNLGVVVALAADHTCPAGSTNRVTPPMMHVWFVPVPGGPTAIDASDAQIVRAAQQARGSGNGPA